jgi:4-diphosphocytidyl-2-C-methyl-D-erythritol kinase
MRIRVKRSRVTVWAPAKINLFLEVRHKRSDGYHEVETAMSAVGIFDTLDFTPTEDGEVRFAVRGTLGSPTATAVRPGSVAAVPNDHTNLVVKAIELLQAHSGTALGAEVDLVKRIPVAAGMGGGSSDAAAALVAANRAWKLGLSHTELLRWAARLGSDVPFFLYDSPAICRGRGEIVEPIRAAKRTHVVIVKPPVDLETAAVYANCTISANPQQVGFQARAGGRYRLFNRLQSAAEKLTPWIEQLRESFINLHVGSHLMTGSGSAYYGICHNLAHAKRVAARLRQLRMGSVFQTYGIM